MRRFAIAAVWMAALMVFAAPWARGQENPATPSEEASAELALQEVAMCEDIRNFAPYRPAIVFSIAAGKVSCFTLFDPVPEKTVIYHRWFHRDNLTAKKRLTLKPPRWATFSTIQLRQADRGPWRVEITDENDELLNILRFSVTD